VPGPVALEAQLPLGAEEDRTLFGSAFAVGVRIVADSLLDGRKQGHVAHPVAHLRIGVRLKGAFAQRRQGRSGLGRQDRPHLTGYVERDGRWPELGLDGKRGGLPLPAPRLPSRRAGLPGLLGGRAAANSEGSFLRRGGGQGQG
jgi:hypothetical protein